MEEIIDQTNKGVQSCQNYVFMQLNINSHAKTCEHRKLTMQTSSK